MFALSNPMRRKFPYEESREKIQSQYLQKKNLTTRSSITTDIGKLSLCYYDYYKMSKLLFYVLIF